MSLRQWIGGRMGLVIVLGVLAADGPAKAQLNTPDDRGRQRDGGRDRDEGRGADRGEEDGTEEGMPRAQVVPGQPRVMPRLMPTGWRLGVFAVNTPAGVRITRVIPSTPAARAGLEPGDRIVTVDGFQVGFVGRRVYPLGEELQRRAGAEGQVALLVQNRRNNELLVLPVRLERFRER